MHTCIQVSTIFGASLYNRIYYHYFNIVLKFSKATIWLHGKEISEALYFSKIFFSGAWEEKKSLSTFKEYTYADKTSYKSELFAYIDSLQTFRLLD